MEFQEGDNVLIPYKIYGSVAYGTVIKSYGDGAYLVGLRSGQSGHSGWNDEYKRTNWHGMCWIVTHGLVKNVIKKEVLHD